MTVGVTRGAKEFREECLRTGIAIEHAVLATLFIIEYKLHRQARTAWPPGLRRMSPIADQITQCRLVCV